MQIFVEGSASRDVAPDQITASATFSLKRETHDQALAEGVKSVKEYLQFIEENTDFQASDFKTHAYTIHENFITNHLDAKSFEDLDKKLTKTISDGFTFSQYAFVKFDYDKSKLSQLLVLTSKRPDAPRFHIDFGLKDYEAVRRDLLGDAYNAAKAKAESLANAAGKHLRDCVRVDIDGSSNSYRGGIGAYDMAKSAAYMSDERSVREEIRTIDETFHPDDITVSKSIDCVWETAD